MDKEKLQDKEQLQDEEMHMENAEPEENDAWKKNARTVIYAMAGVYLLVLAKDMFYAISTSTGTEHIVMIVFTVLFAAAGTGLVFFGILAVWRQMKK